MRRTMNITANRREQFRMRDARVAQGFGAGAFGEAQIGGVIDDTAGIGVLVVDPHRIAVPAIRRDGGRIVHSFTAADRSWSG